MADNKVVNIPSTIQDSNYRYKMPKMILKIEGKGNGIKTNITNLVDVATALDVDPECMELTQTQTFSSSSALKRPPRPSTRRMARTT